MKTKFTFAGLLAICLALAGCDTAPDASDDAHAETTKAVVESTQHAVTLLGRNRSAPCPFFFAPEGDRHADPIVI